MNGYIPAPRATISAHRLWTNLWMRLGQAEDNHIRPGGNRLANDGRHAGIHSRHAAGRPHGTASVDARTLAEQQQRLISPVSTDPMTTTFVYYAEIPSTKQATSAVRRVARWHVPRTGGSFL